MNDRHNIFMKRALDLAALGLGSVSPNPMVGCVIVHNGKIISEGYHQKYGEAHAEVNAIKGVSDLDILRESTAYVTLEPCSHHGKTPPCVDLLIKVGIEKVVIASQDPFEKVDGKGIKKLKDAGIETELGVLGLESDELNKRFVTFHREKRPYVILKWAETSDGFIARENYDSKWISNEKSRQLVHKWRTEEDAILVGKKTVFHDNPLLTARDWQGRNPIRILLDRHLDIAEDFNLFGDDAKTLIINEKESNEKDNIQWIKLEDLSTKSILKQLHSLSIQSVIIEGGAQTLNSFIENDCWDEARVFTSPATFEKGVKAPRLIGSLKHEEAIFEDVLRVYQRK